MYSIVLNFKIMEELKSKSYNTTVKDGKTTITFNETGEDGIGKRACFREVENGWVIDISKEYYEGEGENRTWKSENKTYISKANPLNELKKKNKSKEDKQKEDMNEILGSVKGMIGSLV